MKGLFCLDCERFASINCKQSGHRLTPNYDQEGDQVTTVCPTGETIKFRDLDPKYEGLKRVFKCKIIAVKNIETFDIYKIFICPECNAEFERYSDEFRDIPNTCICSKCDIKCYLDKTQTKTSNIREVLLQEFFEEAAEDKDGNINPRTEEAVAVGDLVYRVFPGQDVVIEGIFRSVKPKTTSKTNKILIDIIRIRPVEEQQEIKPTPEEIEMFKLIPRNLIIKSFAPEIWGMTNEKLGLLLGIIGGTEVDDLRGIINVLLVGDPSVAKSRLLTNARRLLRKSAKVSGRLTSAAGLVAGVD